MISISNIVFKQSKLLYNNLSKVIYLLLGFAQLGLLFTYLEAHNFFLILIHITLFETLVISYKTIHSKKILPFYSSYLLIKYFFSFFIYSYNTTYIDFFILMNFQLLFFFFNIDTVRIYTNKIIRFLSILAILSLSIFMFILNTDFFSYLFFLYLILVFYVLKNKIIREETSFCKDKKFTPNMILRRIKQLPASFASILILTFTGILYPLDLNLFSKMILTLIIVLTIIYEYKQFKIKKLFKFDIFHFIKYYAPIIIFFTIYSLFLWLNNINIKPDSFKGYSENVFITISNIAILNIASLFIIVQLNYTKYGSSYLLYKILKSPILLIITFFPSLIYICSFYFLDLSQTEQKFVPALLILSYSSTLGLFFYTYFFIETHNLMEKLFKDVKYDDFNSYKNNIIQTKERNIDSILTITNRVISNNDTPTSHSLFFYLFCWVNINISQINDQDRFYQTKKNNKFYNFFILIVENIVVSNDSIQKNFLIAIKEMIIYKVDSKNYMNYSLIYRVLFSYLKLSLKNKNEEISKSIYDVIYFNSSNILLNLKKFELTEDDSLNYENDYTTMSDFNSVFIDELHKIKDIAIENNQKDFLYHCRFNHSLFITLGGKGHYDYSKWDGKILEVYKSLKGPRYEIDRYVLKNVKYYGSYLDDYACLLNIDGESTIYKHESLQKYIFNDLISLYLYAIENDLIKSEHDFQLFWSSILMLKYKKNFQVILNLISVFTFLFDKLTNKYIHIEKKESIVNSVFQRVLQIKSYDKELNLETRKLINLRIDTLLKKYPKLNKFIPKDKKRKSNLIKDIDLIKDYNIQIKDIVVDYQI